MIAGETGRWWGRWLVVFIGMNSANNEGRRGPRRGEAGGGEKTGVRRRRGAGGPRARRLLTFPSADGPSADTTFVIL
jgi:hypothetical protein